MLRIMLQIIKIFVIVVICSIFTINIATAQDKKVFDNLGVYLSPMLDLNTYSDEINLYFDGYVIGLKTNIEIYKKISFQMGVGFGKGSYENTNERTNFYYPYGIVLIEKRFSSKIIRTDVIFRYNILELKNKHYLYFLGGSLFNYHTYEMYDFSTFIYENKSLRLFNMSYLVAVGYNYMISSSLILSLDLKYSKPYWINRNNVYNDGAYVALGQYQWMSTGFDLGIIYKF